MPPHDHGNDPENDPENDHGHDHEHGPDCNHDDETLSVQIANQIINVANTRLQDGIEPAEVATGLRHAAANFTAFVTKRGLGATSDPGELVEEFARLLEYYLGRHGEEEKPAQGLSDLIEQAKNEV